MDVPQVLQALLDARGWNQDELAARLSTTQATVSRWLSGDREPLGRKMEAIRALAEESGVIDARPAAERHIVAIMGFIGAGAEIEPDFEQVPFDGLEQVELPYPIGDDMIGFRVRGNSMAPAYEEDAIIVVHREQPWATDGMIGMPAAVMVHDDEGRRRRYLKRIMVGSRPHTFNLESIDARTRTITNVRISWASPVRMIIPNVGLRRISPKRQTKSGRVADEGARRRRP